SHQKKARPGRCAAPLIIFFPPPRSGGGEYYLNGAAQRPGCPSLCVLSLGQARESTPTAVREPQVNLFKLDRLARSANHRARTNKNQGRIALPRDLPAIETPRQQHRKISRRRIEIQ